MMINMWCSCYSYLMFHMFCSFVLANPTLVNKKDSHGTLIGVVIQLQWSWHLPSTCLQSKLNWNVHKLSLFKFISFVSVKSPDSVWKLFGRSKQLESIMTCTDKYSHDNNNAIYPQIWNLRFVVYSLYIEIVIHFILRNTQ